MESIKNNTPIPESKISAEDFDNQFKEKEITIDGQTFRYVKIEPGEAISPQYVLFLGGFGAGAEEYRHEIKDLVLSGRKVLFANPLKGLEPQTDDAEIMDAYNLPQTIQYKVAEIIALLEYAEIRRCDVVCHSQGAAIGATRTSSSWFS